MKALQLLLFLMTLITLLSSCSSSVQPLQYRIPSNDNQPVEIHVTFIDSGLDESLRRYDLHASVESNNLEAIEKISVVIDDVEVKELPFNHENAEIQVQLPFKLPIHKTKIRFNLIDDKIHDVKLVCTRINRCL